MASSYKSVKCDSCGGSLVYSREKKVWICRYCGNEIRREEEYDGLYTIKNVVRQTITDTAYGRLEQARRNLAECEKIDTRYVGTLIARLCVQMFTLITPGECPQSGQKSLIRQIRQNYEDLQKLDQGISAEEEALYESFDGNADVFAVLVVVFDSLGDRVHKEFAENLLDAAKVYSERINDSLLRYAMRSKKLELADRILDNVDNIPCRAALLTVLAEYPDGDSKRRHVRDLFPRAGLSRDERKAVEGYLKTTKDCPETKTAVYAAGVEAGVPASITCVEEYLLKDLGGRIEDVRKVIRLIAQAKPNDAELYRLITAIFTGHSFPVAQAELSELASSGLYIVVNPSDILRMLSRQELSLDERLALVDLAHQFNSDARTNDTILAEYLNRNRDAADIRIPVIEKLLTYVRTIATATLSEYVIRVTTDGKRKPEVLSRILELDLNMSFFRSLMQQYMAGSQDPPDVKAEITALLGRAGLTVDAGTLLDMACSCTQENALETINLVNRMKQSGVHMRSDALSIYLEKAAGRQYYAGLISALYTEGCILSGRAVANYVLYARMNEEVKLRNLETFLAACSEPAGSIAVTVSHLGHRVDCSLLQAYVLTAGESLPTAGRITDMLKSTGAKLNANIQVDQANMKFKKYIMDNRPQLGGQTEALCADNKVFSMFF